MLHVVTGLLVLQALADAEPGVIAEAVRFLTAVCRERQIRKPSLLAAARKVSSAGVNMLCFTSFVLLCLVTFQSHGKQWCWEEKLVLLWQNALLLHEVCHAWLQC